ncbi:MAG: hypothetical protein HOV81_22110 [Kofleriaceae bacterium]|nr:hypothetical protein [Kofleriaceae bacterium]
MNRLALLGLFAGALVGCAADDDPGGDSSLTIENASSYTLVEINLSPVDRVSWGADLLGSDVLAPGDVFHASGIDCNTYDIRVVDEDNDECILDAVDLCLDNAVWSIDDAELASCAF